MDNLIEIKEKAKKLQQEADALFASLTELQQASEKNRKGLTSQTLCDGQPILH